MVFKVDDYRNKKEYSPNEIAGIRMMLAPAVIAALRTGDDTFIEAKRKDALDLFLGTAGQIASIGAHLKIRPTKTIELYAKKGLIIGKKIEPADLLEAAYFSIKHGGLSQEYNRALKDLGSKLKGGEHLAREMVDEVRQLLQSPHVSPLLHSALSGKRSVETNDGFTTMRGPVLDFGKNAKEDIRNRISEYLKKRETEEIARVKVTLDDSVLSLMEQYVAFSCNALSEQAKALLKAACLSNGGTLWKIQKFSERIGVEFPRGAKKHAQLLVDQGLLSFRGREIGTATFSVDPIVQTLIAAELVNAKPIDSKTSPESEAAMSSLCRAITAVLDGDPTPKE